jgi:hypothetical protein
MSIKVYKIRDIFTDDAYITFSSQTKQRVLANLRSRKTKNTEKVKEYIKTFGTKRLICEVLEEDIERNDVREKVLEYIKEHKPSLNIY